MRIPPRPAPQPRTPDRSAPAATTPAAREASSRGTLRREPRQAVAFIQAFDQKLDLPPARLKEKQALMRESASTLFRAMPSLFHEDLRGAWASEARLLERPAPEVPVVGDAHLGNLGTLRGPGGRPVWGLNDFDQAGTASPEVDLTRLATSAVLVAREAGLDAKAQADVAEALGKAYFRELERLADGGDNPGAFLDKKEARGDVDDLIAQAGATSPREALEKYVRLDGKQGPRFQSTDTLRPVPASLERELGEALAAYEKGLGAGADTVKRPLRVMDLAQRLDAGGSSYGLARYYALVQAEDAKKPPVLLEVKELLAPSLARPPAPADGRSAVEYQRELGGDANPLTGSTRLGGRAFLVRELEPEKARLPPKALNSKKELVAVAEEAAVVLARAHGGSASRAAALAGWVGDDAKLATKRLVAFARGYADQAEADWSALRA